MKKLLKILGWIIVFGIVFCLSGKIYGCPSGIELQDIQQTEHVVSVFPTVSVEFIETGYNRHTEWLATFCLWIFFIAGIFVWLSLYDVEWGERIKRGFFLLAVSSLLSAAIHFKSVDMIIPALLSVAVVGMLVRLEFKTLSKLTVVQFIAHVLVTCTSALYTYILFQIQAQSMPGDFAWFWQIVLPLGCAALAALVGSFVYLILLMFYMIGAGDSRSD
jgi:hypothetical protein